MSVFVYDTHTHTHKHAAGLCCCLRVYHTHTHTHTHSHSGAVLLFGSGRGETCNQAETGTKGRYLEGIFIYININTKCVYKVSYILYIMQYTYLYNEGTLSGRYHILCVYTHTHTRRDAIWKVSYIIYIYKHTHTHTHTHTHKHTLYAIYVYKCICVYITGTETR